MKKKIEIKTDQDELVGTLFSPDVKKDCPVVVFMNGSGGLKERFYGIAEDLLDKNIISICFDFRGRGESDIKTEATTITQIEDAENIIDYVSKNIIFGKKEITIIATSMGAFVATCVCNYSDDILRLILIAPANYPHEMETINYQDVSVRNYVKNDLINTRSMKEMRKFKGRVDVVRLTKDETIPDWMDDSYYKNANKARYVKKHFIDFKHAILRYKEGRKMVGQLLFSIL